MPTLSTLLQHNRQRFFVGRKRELSLIEHLLEHPAEPPHLVFLHGPAGIGKSTLLAAIQQRLGRSDAALLSLDGRELALAPSQLRESLDKRIAETIAANPESPLWIIIDSFEHLATLQGWFHEVLLPQMPSTVRWLLGGRQPPEAHWRNDPAWTGLMRCIELGPLSAAEADSYLAQRELPEAVQRQIGDFAQGYPLALAIGADLCLQEGLETFDPPASRKLLQQLAQQFVTDARIPGHATALQALALTHALSEPMLAAMIPDQPAPALYNWLSSLSFVMGSAEGLVLHELVAQAIVTDLHGRAPDKAEQLIVRAEEFLLRQLAAAALPAPATVQALTHLARQGEVSDHLHIAAHAQPLYSDAARPGELAHIRDLIAQHESPLQLQRFDQWHAHQPAGLTVFRDHRDHLCGFAFFVELTVRDGPAIDDPVIAEVLAVARQEGAAGEELVDCCRFWMDAQQHMALTSTMANTMTLLVARACAHDSPGTYALILPDTPLSRSLAQMAEHQCLPCPEAVGPGQQAILTVHRWGDESVSNWLVRTNRRVRGMQKNPPAQSEPPLDYAELHSALKKVLRHFHDTNTLKQSPLLCSPLCANDQSVDERAALLRELILDAAAELKELPKTEHYYELLHHSYFRPAKSRLDVATRLHMTSSTYYRHLAKAIDLLASKLHARQSQR